MPQRIVVTTEIDPAKEIARFIIKIPLNLINNSNFFEVMGALEFTNPSAWLRVLADVIEESRKGQQDA